MRPVVVTGASGFVGRRLLQHLSKQRIDAVALSRRADAALSLPGVRPFTVEHYAEFVPAAGSVLIHLAEPPHIAAVDSEGPAHIARMQDQAAALLKRSYARAIFVSSATVYGDARDTPWRPDDALPHSPKIYPQSKLAVEKLFTDAAGVIARFTNLYGPGMARTTIFADIIGQLGRARAVTIREVTPLRDYLWVDDAVEALAAMALGRAHGIYNVASGRAISCGDLAGLILTIAGEPGRQVKAGQPPRHSVLRLDITKTAEDFGWSPRVVLESGIRLLLKSEKQ